LFVAQLLAQEESHKMLETLHEQSTDLKTQLDQQLTIIKTIDARYDKQSATFEKVKNDIAEQLHQQLKMHFDDLLKGLLNQTKSVKNEMETDY